MALLQIPISIDDIVDAVDRDTEAFELVKGLLEEAADWDFSLDLLFKVVLPDIFTLIELESQDTPDVDDGHEALTIDSFCEQIRKAYEKFKAD